MPTERTTNVRLLSTLSLVALGSCLALVACGDDDDEVPGGAGSGGTAGKGGTSSTAGKGGTSSTAGKGGTSSTAGKGGNATSGTDTGGSETGGTETGGTTTGGTGGTTGGTSTDGGVPPVEGGGPSVAGDGGGGEPVTGGGGAGGEPTGEGGGAGDGGTVCPPSTAYQDFAEAADVAGAQAYVLNASYNGPPACPDPPAVCEPQPSTAVTQSPTDGATACGLGALKDVIVFTDTYVNSFTEIPVTADWSASTKLHGWLKVSAANAADYDKLAFIQLYVKAGTATPTTAYGGWTDFTVNMRDGNWREFIVTLDANKADIKGVGVQFGASAGVGVTLYMDELTLE
jgi:hypothetical protein